VLKESTSWYGFRVDFVAFDELTELVCIFMSSDMGKVLSCSLQLQFLPKCWGVFWGLCNCISCIFPQFFAISLITM